MDAPYRMLADLVLATHFGIVVFVVGALPLIVVGNVRGWAFVNGWWFRLAHLAAIAVVAAQAWLGVVCPLTTLENWLRAEAGQATYDSSFIEHWLTRLCSSRRRHGCSRPRIRYSPWQSRPRGGGSRRVSADEFRKLPGAASASGL